MTDTPARDLRSTAVRERVLEGVAELLAAGEELTFAKLAKVAGVPERTVYRHFGTRGSLLDAVFEWSNRQIGFDGKLPVDAASAAALVRRVFPGFDRIAPVIHELLISTDGVRARLAHIEERRNAAIALVQPEAPELDTKNARRVAAVVQALMTASTWQTLRDYWDMDGAEAGEAAALAIELLLAGARKQKKKGSR